MDFQTRQCRNLLASVVQLAVTDACSQPGDKPTVDALSAMRFLFDERYSGLTEYAEFLDFDPGQFRQRLLTIMKDQWAREVNGFAESQRRNFMKNFRYWQKHPLEVRMEVDHVDN